MLSIGLMSGTSMDGIDAALIETDGEKIIKELHGVSLTYDTQFKIQLKEIEATVRKYSGNISAAKKYSTEHVFDEVIKQSTQLHIEAVKRLLEISHYSADQIDVIGYHGQTLFHQPANKITIQVGDSQLLADQINITVVNDFRSRDVLAGGHGAPLAPLYHQALAIRDQKIPIAIVNCGGIANLTIITGETTDDIVGFDTGPGNGLIDRYIKLKTLHQEHMDTDGKYGNKGKINNTVFEKFYQLLNPFLNLKPPKSLDIGDFELIPELNVLSIEDACATLEAFTADTIVKSIDHIATDIPKLWVLAGGGWNNPVIYSELKKRLQNKLGSATEVKLADEIGWNSKYMEAQLIAYLAARCLQNKPITFPSTTQAPKPLTGGKIYIPHTA